MDRIFQFHLVRIHDDQIDFVFFDEFQNFLNPVPVADVREDLEGFSLIVGHEGAHLFLCLFLQSVVEILIFRESSIGDDFNDMEKVNGAFVFFRKVCCNLKGVDVLFGKVCWD
jgi:hypothetical protein